MPIGPARMPLLDHLGELRMRLVRIVVCLLIAVCVFYMATPTIAHFMLAPVAKYMPQTVDGQPALAVFGAFDAFQVRFNVAIWSAVLACMPVIMWQTLAFFLPALKPKERKWFIPTFVIAVCLFIFGSVFCYLVILDPAFQWLTDQADGLASIVPQADKWIDIIIKFEIGFGFAFELPLVVFYLTIFEVIPYAKLRHSWRTVYIVLLVLSAMITPDSSPVTMALLFVPLIAMYEISMAAARVVLGRKIQQQEKEAAEDEAADEELVAEHEKKKAARAKA